MEKHHEVGNYVYRIELRSYLLSPKRTAMKHSQDTPSWGLQNIELKARSLLEMMSWFKFKFARDNSCVAIARVWRNYNIRSLVLCAPFQFECSKLQVGQVQLKPSSEPYVYLVVRVEWANDMSVVRFRYRPAAIQPELVVAKSNLNALHFLS